MEDEEYEHSPSGEESDCKKKQCHIINNLLHVTSLAQDSTGGYWPGRFCKNLVTAMTSEVIK